MSPSNKFYQTDIYNTHNKLIASGYLWNESGNYVEIRGKAFPKLEEGDKLRIIASHKDGKTVSYYTHVYIGKENYLSLFVISKTIDSNQRKYFRIKASLRSSLFYEVDQNGVIPLKKPIDICVLDISLGGLRFSSKADLQAGRRYRVVFILNKNVTDFVFEIVRVLKTENQYHEYGCVITEISPKSERYLCQYIFYKERQQLLKAKDILENESFIRRK